MGSSTRKAISTAARISGPIALLLSSSGANFLRHEVRRTAGSRRPVHINLTPSSPQLEHAVDTKVFVEHASHHDLQLGVSPCPRRQPGRIAPPGDMVAVARRGDRQHSADRLDPVVGAVVIDEGDHRFSGRSSSAIAK